ncbi:hypothetical protein C4572_00040 [Candidatus Parcubacteria bacterium]|nr:MAG: hypothetical protein C4572_00040 [Candidatus Parcubacteria bacterium]
MKNKILFFNVVMSLVVIAWQSQAMAAWPFGGDVEAEELKPLKTILSPDCEKEEEEELGIAHYVIQGAEIPNNGSAMTFTELNKLSSIPDSYSWMGMMVRVPSINLGDMRARKMADNTDQFGVQANSLLHRAKALAIVVKGESAQMRGELVKETRRVLGEVDEVFCGLIGDTINQTLSEGKSFAAMQSNVEVHEGCINGNKPFIGITAKGKLNPLEQSFDLFLNGEPVKFKFVVCVGNLGDKQTESVMKIYALAYATNTSNYSIIGCADVEAQPVDKEGFRTVPLTLMASKIRAEKVRGILAGMPYCLQDWQINDLLAPNKTNLAASANALMPDESESQACSTNITGGGNPQ